MSTPTSTALQGTGSGMSTPNTSTIAATQSPVDDFKFSSQLLSLLDVRDEALQVLKSDLMDALNKEVKSLDEDNWMFEGPRSRINLIAKPGGSFAMRSRRSPCQWNIGPSS